MRGAFDTFRHAASDQLDVLRTSLEAASGGSPGAEQTVRRMARSLARTAEEHGLPMLRRLAEDVATARSYREMSAGSRVFLEAVANGPSGQGRARILIIEDDPTAALLLESWLASDDRTVCSVDTAAGALLALGEHSPDVILLDLVLPDADGRDLLLRIRERPASSETPVIVLSARPVAEARDECLALGAQEYLQKPVDPSSTRAVVEAQLARLRGPGRIEPRSGFADRATLTRAFDDAMARAESRDEEHPVLASLEFEADHRPSEGRDPLHDLWTACAPIREVLAPGDVLSRGRGPTLVALFVDSRPDDVKARLESAAPGDVGFRAGVAPVAPGSTLGAAVKRTQRLLSLARAGDMPRILASEPGRGGPALRVLLVEDDPVTATLVRHRLTKDGFDVEHFEDGEEALEAARGGGFSVAVFDVKLGGMDGFELLQRVRALDRFRGVPILMLTAMGRESDIVRGFDLGADDYLLKPFSPVELVARIHRLLAS